MYHYRLRTLIITALISFVIAVFGMYKIEERKLDRVKIMRETVEDGYLVDDQTGKVWHTIPVSQDSECMPCHADSTPEGKIDISDLKCSYKEAEKKNIERNKL